MFLYIFAICLASFYSSSGAPAPQTNATNPVSLSALAKICENPFLASQIQSKVEDCAPTVTTNSEKQFQCMLFFDINRQLCTAVASAKIALTGDYSSKINAPQDITHLCDAARGWTFTDLGETYKKYVKLVFPDVARCVHVCSADNDNMLNVESNFFCKYFMWGTEMLKTQVSVDPSPSQVAAVSNSKVPAENSAIPPSNLKPIAVDTAVSDKKAVNVKPEVPAPINPSVGGTNNIVQLKKEETTSLKDPKVPVSDTQEVVLSQASADPSSQEKVSSTNKVSSESHVDPSVPEEHSNVEPSPIVNKKDTATDNEPVKENSEPPKEVQAEVNPVGAAPDLAEAVEKQDADVNVSEDKKEKAPESVKNEIPPIDPKNNQNNDLIDGDDYVNDLDSEDSRGPDVQQGDDDTDPGLESDLKPGLDLNKNDKRIELQSAADISQKEFYRGEDFPEEEDHFFPFFLTAIIMVVLLYVLYHNKSKVSKVIMGLIIEGRQPGRRRNSRGHAYKRLDTLEQAMSTNSAAPPSKIIY